MSNDNTHIGIECKEEGISLDEYCSVCLDEHYADLSDTLRKMKKEGHLK